MFFGAGSGQFGMDVSGHLKRNLHTYLPDCFKRLSCAFAKEEPQIDRREAFYINRTSPNVYSRVANPATGRREFDLRLVLDPMKVLRNRLWG